ncbi:hypothetical protein C0995_005218 [Termitomyces sp. Mi166|nr:hypothetical protein C0995_005218 [Termitomyces sp. Mi166\
MSESSLVLLIYVALVISTALLIKSWRYLILQDPHPDSFPGNYRDLPTILPWLKYTEWAKQYGNLVHLKAFNNHIVVVNTVEDANALFERRSRLYSDRPTLTMVNLAAFVRYGDKWRRHRKLFQQTLNKAAVRRTQEPTQIKVHEYLSRLLAAPDDFATHVRKQVTSLFLSLPPIFNSSQH